MEELSRYVDGREARLIIDKDWYGDVTIILKAGDESMTVTESELDAISLLVRDYALYKAVASLRDEVKALYKAVASVRDEVKDEAVAAIKARLQ